MHVQKQWKEHIVTATAVHSQMLMSHESAIALFTQEVDIKEKYIKMVADQPTKLEMELSGALEIGENTSIR